MSKFGIESLISASEALAADPKIVEMVKDDGSTLLHDAASGKATKIAPADMIEHRVIVDKLNKDGCTALHLAVHNGKILELLPRMIDNMSQESIEAASLADGNTALHYAIDRGRFDIASQLTDRMSPESLTRENPYKLMGSIRTQISVLEFAGQKAAQAAAELANSVAIKDGAKTIQYYAERDLGCASLVRKLRERVGALAGHHVTPSVAFGRGAKRDFGR